MTEEVKTEVKKENPFKKFLTLEPVLINKIGKKFKPFAKYIYWALSIILGLSFIKAVVDLFISGFSAFLLETILIAVYFIVVRMFSEYLANN
ncbi:MAG: hypothetical protein IJV07_02900 [Alphaproteobacteria bacterium]|nr:hypothetical protein [Alphaproteobacteria bacterium]